MADRMHDDRHPDALRRRLLQAGGAAAALGALPGASVVAHAQGAFDWKRFKGQKIEILLVKSPRGDLLSKYHKEFEELTGIEVGSEMVPEQQQRQKAVIELATVQRFSEVNLAILDQLTVSIGVVFNTIEATMRFVRRPPPKECAPPT